MQGGDAHSRWEGKRRLVPPGSGVLGAFPPRGVGQVGGIQIFLEVPQRRAGAAGTRASMPSRASRDSIDGTCNEMRPRKGQQSRPRTEGRQKGRTQDLGFFLS